MSDADYLMEDVWALSRAPSEDYRLYPGRKVLYPAYYDGEYVFKMKPALAVDAWTLKHKKEIKTISQVLKEKGATPVGERYAVVCWDHMSAPGEIRAQGLTDVIILPAILVGYHAVFSGRKTLGYMAGSLSRWTGHRYPTFVCLYDAAQLDIVDGAEERQTGEVHLVKLLEGTCTIDSGPELKEMYAYLPDNRFGLICEDGAPVPLPTYWQGDLQERMAKMTRQPITDYISAEGIPFPRKPPLTFAQNLLAAPSTALPMLGGH